MTTLRPDMVFVLEATKQLVMLELTVPWEHGIEESFERKRAKYEKLTSECRNMGWKAWCQPIKVSCRGFAGWSLGRALKQLGIIGLHIRRAIKNITDAAERTL